MHSASLGEAFVLCHLPSAEEGPSGSWAGCPKGRAVTTMQVVQPGHG